jgi:hypothetical protein
VNDLEKNLEQARAQVARLEALRWTRLGRKLKVVS